MKKTLVIILTLIALALPFAYADVITPGTHGVSINNQITNINDFPDYVFVSYVGNTAPGLSMCPIRIIENGGQIGSYYKFCSISVYAIPKSKFNENILANRNETQVAEYFNSTDIKKVLEGISTYTSFADADPTTEIDNSYTADLNLLQKDPSKTDIKRNNLVYLYIILPVLALIIIIYIILRKKKK